jgi:hypothetical protein
MAGGFEVDPSALEAASVQLGEHADGVEAISGTLEANTARAVGSGEVGHPLDAAVKRGLRIVAHDLGGAVRNYYQHIALALRTAANEARARDEAASSAFDRLGRDSTSGVPGRGHVGPVGRHRAGHWDGRAGDDLPADRNGWHPNERTLDYLGIIRRQVGWWSRGEALLGMTPMQYGEFRSSMLAALERDGISPDTVDARAHGSRARFYAGDHKPFETDAELSMTAAGRRGLREWFGDDPNRPVRHMVNSRYRLGLDEPSDYDINLSSDEMVRRACEKYDAGVAAGTPYREVWATRGDGTPAHGFLNDGLMHDTFPHVSDWADHWSHPDRLGARVSWAVFRSTGPTAATPSGMSVRFRDTDWIIHSPGDA